MVKVYPKYKDSGAPWFGEVPSHWQTPRLGSVLRERKETNKANDVTKILSVMKDIGVIPYEEKGRVGNKCSEDITRYKIVRPGDIVANCMNIIIGSVGLSKYTGCLSPVYYVLTPRSQEDDSRFFDYVFKIKSFQLSLVRLGNGIMAHRMRIPMELLKCETVPKPPADEQNAIVGYLDAVNKIIHRYIREKQKVIKLLNEQKQAIINKAVARGVDPNVRFKSSGIEWLGDIPEHWEIRRLKNVGKALIGLTYSPDDISDDSGMLVLRSSNIKNGKMVRDKDVYVKKQIPEKLIVKSGDILICARNGSRKLVGKCAIVNKDFSGATFGVFMSIFRSQINDFIYCVLNSNIFGFLAANFSTSTINQLTINDLNNLPIPLPPRNEQKNIVNYIREESVKFDEAIYRMDKEIEIIREYRARLISDTVTGKIDVRDAKLPEIEDVTNSETIEDQETLEVVEDTEEVVNADE